MQQLELGFWPMNCVRTVLMDYLAMRAEGIVEETRTDYETRLEWLCEALGPWASAESIGFPQLERLAREARTVLADRTITMRLQFLAAAIDYAGQRGVISTARPKLPPWLRGCKPMHDYLTQAQFAEFRLGLPPAPIRRFADLGFWTGMHTLDVEATERWMLEPEYAWEGSDQRGRWWRRNRKNKKCRPAYVPMEPEFRELALGWLSTRGAPNERICGTVHNKRKYFDLAAERAELPRIRPNLGLRSSHSTLLLARGYSYEYVRLVLGHQGEIRAEVRADGAARAVTTRPSVLTGHYLRPSPETLRPRQ